ncbi:hypothetical protein [Macrococcus carouselicus]|uniref:LPXTG cell wall anchor domain-containing protein n=1 Tax=Macrococcus carouselicus TaxID=69969 RepID=A0A9Q8CCV5_9STAP|nr:hypothetical protein [Macrococcus carouselicus]TDM00692.1 hypothetical protein ERX40_09120 [Macrococcus carouselicus]
MRTFRILLLTVLTLCISAPLQASHLVKVMDSNNNPVPHYPLRLVEENGEILEMTTLSDGQRLIESDVIMIDDNKVSLQTPVVTVTVPSPDNGAATEHPIEPEPETESVSDPAPPIDPEPQSDAESESPSDPALSSETIIYVITSAAQPLPSQNLLLNDEEVITDQDGRLTLSLKPDTSYELSLQNQTMKIEPGEEKYFTVNSEPLSESPEIESESSEQPETVKEPPSITASTITAPRTLQKEPTSEEASTEATLIIQKPTRRPVDTKVKEPTQTKITRRVILKDTKPLPQDATLIQQKTFQKKAIPYKKTAPHQTNHQQTALKKTVLKQTTMKQDNLSHKKQTETAGRNNLKPENLTPKPQLPPQLPTVDPRDTDVRHISAHQSDSRSPVSKRNPKKSSPPISSKLPETGEHDFTKFYSLTSFLIGSFLLYAARRSRAS